MKLSDEQQQVITSDQNLKVVASPGSGKTHVLVEYAADKIQKDGESKILLVTFSRDAALEIRKRLKNKCIPLKQNIQVTTFDSLFFNLFKRIEAYVTQENIVLGAELQAQIAQFLNRHPNLNYSFEDLLSIYNQFSYVQTVSASVKKTKKYKTFKELIYFLLNKRLYDLPTINRMVNERLSPIDVDYFDYVIVDEFQDINPIQYDFLAKYSNTGTKMVVIGDDDQSIYKFRHALGYKGFKKFVSDFSADVLTLSTSYRCPQEVLDCAYALVSENETRYKKKVEGVRAVFAPELHCFESAEEEVSFFIRSQNDVDAICDTVILSRKKRDLLYIALMLQDKGIDFTSQCVHEELNKSGLQDLLDICRLLNSSMILSFYENSGFADNDRAYQYLSEILSKYRCDDVSEELFRAYLEKLMYTLSSLLTSEQSTDYDHKCLFDCLDTLLSNNLKSLLLDIDLHCGFKSVGKTLGLLVELSQKLTVTDDDEGLKLMTMHKSKGLQWSKVWIMAAHASKLIHRSQEELEEERRIYFVAMTRSMRRLIITGLRNNIAFSEQLEKVMLSY